MKVTVSPTCTLTGELNAPPSKAHTHRALFAGLLSDGVTKIQNPLSCVDTEATAHAIESLGASIKRTSRNWAVDSDGRPKAPANAIECSESGVTLRFSIPIASLTGRTIRLVGRESLMHRPIEPLANAMNQLGVHVIPEPDGFRVEGGPPTGGVVRIRGDVSSQFISGLLFAGPLMRDGLKLQLTSPLESRNYVAVTITTMKRHGVEVESKDGMSVFEVTSQEYRPANHEVPGDYSSAAFAMSAAAITNSTLLIRGLPQESSEPDSVLLDILSKMGAKARALREGVLVEGGNLKGLSLDLRDCPDLGPVVAVLGCYAEGETIVSGAGRLRYKESDRLETVGSELRSLGAEVKETDDGLVIRGPCSLEGGLVNSHRDHRVAMALSVAALRAKGRVVIEGAESVDKSYPSFFNDLRSLGVEVVGG